MALFSKCRISSSTGCLCLLVPAGIREAPVLLTARSGHCGPGTLSDPRKMSRHLFGGSNRGKRISTGTVAEPLHRTVRRCCRTDRAAIHLASLHVDPEDRLKGAPSYNAGTEPNWGDPQYAKELHDYYGSKAAWYRSGI